MAGLKSSECDQPQPASARAPEDRRPRVNSLQNEQITNSLSKRDDVNRIEAINSGLFPTDLRPSELVKVSTVSDVFLRGSANHAMRMSISGTLREISSQSSIASSPEKVSDAENTKEKVAEGAFGGLSHLMYSEEALADSYVVSGPQHWTLSTKSDCEEDRALKFAMSLKRVRKTTQQAVKAQLKSITQAEMKARIEAQASLVQIELSNVERQMEGRLDRHQQLVEWMKQEFITVLKLRKALVQRGESKA